MSLKSIGLTAGLLVTLLAMSACGKKGPLSLPDTMTAKEQSRFLASFHSE